jgi:putative ABC transport system permease protein
MESFQRRISAKIACMSLSYLRFAWRSLMNNKGYAIINLIGLATGICSCLTIYTLTAYELSFDTFHPDTDRIYRVGARIQEHDTNDYGEEVAPPTGDALRREIPGVETSARYYMYTIGDTNAILTDGNYFKIFPYHWLAGNPTTALSYPFSVVLTETQARKYFGRTSPNQPQSPQTPNQPQGPQTPDHWLGREIVYEGSLHVHVTGIVRDWTGNTDFPYTDLISFCTISHSPILGSRFHPDSWEIPPHGNPWTRTLIKLSPHTDPARIMALLPPFVTRHLPADPMIRILHLAFVLQPLTDIHFNTAYAHDGTRKAHLPVLYGLTGAAIFILLLAIVNFINLSTAQSQRRARETGIRRILGSSRQQLFLLFLSETALITILATLLSLLLVYPVIALFHAYLPADLHYRPFDGPALLFLLGIVALTTLLSGIYPARVLSTPTISKRRYTARKMLIVFQFTISLIFIIGSITFGKQLHFMLTANPGFARNAVITIDNFQVPPAQLKRFAQKAQQIPGVEQLILQGHAPAGDAIIEIPILLDHQKNEETMVSLQAGDDHFLAFYRIPLLVGRNLRSGDSTHEVLINDTYRHILGFKTPEQALGHFVTLNEQPCPIVGVIADFHAGSFHDPIFPLLVSHLPRLQHSLALRLTPGTPINTALTQLAKNWHDIFPDQPFDYHFLDESIARLYAADIQMSWLVHAATALTVFLSCMGLFGLILYIVENRKKEISIRKLLGAGVADIVLLLNREFAGLIAIALLIATPIAGYTLHHWLESYTYRITLSWQLFALAGLFALLVTLLTIAARVISAARLNPVDHLRSSD